MSFSQVSIHPCHDTREEKKTITHLIYDIMFSHNAIQRMESWLSNCREVFILLHLQQTAFVIQYKLIIPRLTIQSRETILDIPLNCFVPRLKNNIQITTVTYFKPLHISIMRHIFSIYDYRLILQLTCYRKQKFHATKAGDLEQKQ